MDNMQSKIAAALAKAQSEIKNPEKTKTAKAGSYSYKYADIADVLNQALPVLSKNGIAVTQPTHMVDGSLIVTTRLLHSSGEFIESEYPVSGIQGGDHQKIGAALTYARRYALCSLIGVAAEEDTDAQGAAKAGGASGKRVSAHQAKKEVDWPAVEKSIREASTERKLDNIAARVDDHDERGSWPESYISSAREMIETRREELAKIAIKDSIDPDKYLSDLEAELAGARDKTTLDEIWVYHESSLEGLFPPDQTKARKLYDEYSRRLAA